MRYVIAALLLGATLTIAPHAPVQAGPSKPQPQSPAPGGQEQIPPGSWLLYDSYDEKVPIFGPFQREIGCLLLAQTLNQYAMDNADDPYTCRQVGTAPEARPTSGGWVVYDGKNTAIFGPFESQEKCGRLVETLNDLALDEAEDPYACRAR